MKSIHEDEREGKMAKYDAKEIAQDAAAVFKMIDEEMNLPEWIEAKITIAAHNMNAVKDYLTHHMSGDKLTNENLLITTEQAKQVLGNTCINCGNLSNEDLRKWFSDKWVNIGKKKKGGGHPPCGTSGDKRGYAKCVPASKASSMSKKQKSSATRRKRSAQNKAGRGGTSSIRGGGKKPIRVNTKPKK